MYAWRIQRDPRAVLTALSCSLPRCGVWGRLTPPPFWPHHKQGENMLDMDNPSSHLCFLSIHTKIASRILLRAQPLALPLPYGEIQPGQRAVPPIQGQSKVQSCFFLPLAERPLARVLGWRPESLDSCVFSKARPMLLRVYCPKRLSHVSKRKGASAGMGKGALLWDATPPTTFTVTTIGSEIIVLCSLPRTPSPRVLEARLRHVMHKLCRGVTRPFLRWMRRVPAPPHQISSEDQQGPRLLTCHILHNLQDFFSSPRAMCHGPEWVASFKVSVSLCEQGVIQPVAPPCAVSWDWPYYPWP